MKFLDVIRNFMQAFDGNEYQQNNCNFENKIKLKMNDGSLYKVLKDGRTTSTKFQFQPSAKKSEPVNLLIASHKKEDRLNILTQVCSPKRKTLILDLSGVASDSLTKHKKIKRIDFKEDVWNIFGMNLGFTNYSDVQSHMLAVALSELSSKEISFSEMNKGKVITYFSYLLREKKFLESCRQKYKYKAGIYPQIDKALKKGHRTRELSEATWIDVSYKLLIDNYEEEATIAVNYGSPRIEDFIPFARKHLNFRHLDERDKEMVENILINLSKLIEVEPILNQPTSFNPMTLALINFDFSQLMKNASNYKDFFISYGLLFSQCVFNMGYFTKQISDIVDRDIQISAADLPEYRSWRTMKSVLDDIDMMHLYQFAAPEYDKEPKQLVLIDVNQYEKTPMVAINLRESRLNNLTMIATSEEKSDESLYCFFGKKIISSSLEDGNSDNFYWYSN